MILLLCVFCTNNEIRCGHHELPSFVNTRTILADTNPMQYKEENRIPIKIYFDTKGFGPFGSGSDSKMCQSIGAQINWGSYSHTCTSEDILTSQDVNVLNDTLVNVKNYLTKLIKINSPETISISQNSFFDVSVSQSAFPADLHVSVFVRGFGTNIDITGQAFGFSTIDYRPIQGALVVSPRIIPGTSQDENSTDRTFFLALLHEMIHILGMTEKVFPNWIERTRAFPYVDFPLANYSDQRFPNKSFIRLKTPIAKQYSHKKWKISDNSDFEGIELEDGGGANISLCHLESRVFFSELMTAHIHTHSYISDATLALLADMGWYSPNFNMSEPLPWGSGQSIGMSEMTNFSYESPVSVFPSHYLCDSNDAGIDECSYDFKSLAQCSSNITYQCPELAGSDLDHFCNARRFFNPELQNISIGNISNSGKIYDFQYMKIPKSGGYCLNENTIVGAGGESGLNSRCTTFITNHSTPQRSSSCYPMQCVDVDSITITVNGTDQTCTKGAEISFIDEDVEYTIKCPDPYVLCNTENYANSQNNLYTLDLLPGDTGYYTMYIIMLVVIIVVLVGGIVGGAIWYCCYRETDPDHHTQSSSSGGKKKRIKKKKRVKKNRNSSSNEGSRI